MPVDVIFGEVQKRRGGTRQALRGLQLKARKLEHPDLGQGVGLKVPIEFQKGARADVARGNGRVDGAGHLARQNGRRGLAVGARDADDDRFVMAKALEARKLPGKQFDFAHDLGADLAGGPHQGRSLGKLGRKARAQDQQIELVAHEVHVKGRADEFWRRVGALKELDSARVFGRIDDGGAPTARMQKAGGRSPRSPAAQHQRPAAVFNTNMRHGTPLRAARAS